MIRMLIKPNLAMILPVARFAMLGGEKYKIKEFQLRHVAAYERKITAIVGHPHRHHTPRPDDGDPEALTKWKRSRVRASQQWPPSMGSEQFLAAKSTTAGVLAFLKILLRRYHRNLSTAQIGDTASRMDAREWDLAHRVAWGYADWEEFDPADATDSGPGEGTDWADTVSSLVRDLRIPFREIERMYVSQLRLITSKNGQRMACMRPLEVQGTL